MLWHINRQETLQCCIRVGSLFWKDREKQGIKRADYSRGGSWGFLHRLPFLLPFWHVSLGKKLWGLQSFQKLQASLLSLSSSESSVECFSPFILVLPWVMRPFRLEWLGCWLAPCFSLTICLQSGPQHFSSHVRLQGYLKITWYQPLIRCLHPLTYVPNKCSAFDIVFILNWFSLFRDAERPE